MSFFNRFLLFRFRKRELSTGQISFISKTLALLMGFCCLAVATLAGYVGGILEAALKILGLVGGPMLGLYTLGMFTETANQAGAIIGFLTSLTFSFCFGFGGPNPSKLPVSIDGCNSTQPIIANFTLNPIEVSMHNRYK